MLLYVWTPFFIVLDLLGVFREEEFGFYVSHHCGSAYDLKPEDAEELLEEETVEVTA